jgi:D-beta-D-heptose 7-phosphate kinase/D-beta-D-heptose 1-phosphate adenosyltransferase
MLDCYYWGDANRISPEAPVPVVDLTEVTYVLGGAANVAANVVSLGQDCILMGVIGKDEEAVVLTRLLRDLGVTDYLVVEKDRPTTTKSRVVAGGQHLLRLDNEDTSPLYDARDMAAYAIRLGIKYHIPVFVDPKGTEWAKYRNAFCVTPNMKEFIEFFNYDFNSEISTIEEIIAVAPEVVEVFDLNYLCVTLGDGGILVADKEVNIYPAEKAEVIDVSGAGDTVIASFAVDAAGIEDPLAVDMKWAAKFANRTAAVAVSKLGTVAVAFYEVEYD